MSWMVVAMVMAATASSPIRPYAREYMVVPSPHINSLAITGAAVSRNLRIKCPDQPNRSRMPPAIGDFVAYT